MLRPKKLSLQDVEIVLKVEQDDTPVRGNAMVSDDDALDKEIEDGILLRLDNGDVWAWAHVTIEARYAGLTGCDHLGCCSYKNEGEFREDGDFADMKDRALEDLQEQINKLAPQIAEC